MQELSWSEHFLYLGPQFSPKWYAGNSKFSEGWLQPAESGGRCKPAEKG